MIIKKFMKRLVISKHGKPNFLYHILISSAHGSYKHKLVKKNLKKMI